MSSAQAANTLLAISLQGTVHAVSVDGENPIDAARQIISSSAVDTAPVLDSAELAALLRDDARFATLRSTDRRPHPACARGLLARIDARVRSTGLRACIATCDAPSDAWTDPLSFADAWMSRSGQGFAARIRLCEDVDDLRVARTMPAAVVARFTRGVRAARPALTALCQGALDVDADAEGALRIRVAALHVAPHVLLASVLAAGVDAGAGHAEGAHRHGDARSASPIDAVHDERATPPTLAALLGQDVTARLHIADATPPGGPSL